MPHPALLSAADTALLMIDVQEKLIGKIFNKDSLIVNIAFLLDAAAAVGVPASATEQYPKGLGPTVAELAKRLPERPDKVAFSSCAAPLIVEGFHAAGRRKILLAGIETHVCVSHTAFDLLDLGFAVYVAADAVGSRYAVDHEYALRRLEKAGAILTTAEAVAFEWVGGSSHPKFKQISLLVQERMKSLNG